MHWDSLLAMLDSRMHHDFSGVVYEEPYWAIGNNEVVEQLSRLASSVSEEIYRGV